MKCRAVVGQEARPRQKGEASFFWSLVVWVWVLPALSAGALLCITVGLVAGLLGDKRRRVAHKMLALGYNITTRGYTRVKCTVTGRENLPPGACILCVNHQSYSDVVYLYRLDFHFKWIVKSELFWVPPFGMAMRIAQYPKIKRGDAGSAVELMKTVEQNLQWGVPILTFPEGSRSQTGELGRFQNGPARMAIVNQVPVVPVGIIGTGRLLPKGSIAYPARGHVSIHIGEPIPTRELGRSDVRPLTRQLRRGVIAAKEIAQRAIFEDDHTRGEST